MADDIKNTASTKFFGIIEKCLGKSFHLAFAKRLANQEAYRQRLAIDNKLYEQEKLNELDIEKAKQLNQIALEKNRAEVELMRSILPDEFVSTTLSDGKVSINLNQETYLKSQLFLAENVSKFRELKKLNNIENIIYKTYEELSGDASVTNTEKEIDDGWLHDFFDYSENIFDDKLQLIWGKILAGEIKSPGKFSIRTLHAIKLLNTYEAECFLKLAEYIIITDDLAFLLNKSNPILLDKRHEAIVTENLGFYQVGQLTLTIEKKDEVFSYFNYGSYKIRTKERVLLIVSYVSSIARQLIELVDVEIDLSHLHTFMYEIGECEYCFKTGEKQENGEPIYSEWQHRDTFILKEESPF